MLDARYDRDTGVGRYVAGLQRALRESSRFTYRFVGPERDRAADVIPVRARPYSIREQVELPWVLRRAHPRLVHAPYFLIPLLWPGRLIVTIHDVIPLDFPDSLSSRARALYPALLRAACARAVSVLVPSVATAEELVRRGLATMSRIVVTPLAPSDLPPPRGDAPPFGDRPYVLSVGLLRRHKNLPVLVKAFARVVGRRDLLLVIAGEGPERPSLHELAQELGVGDQVRLLGHVPDADISALYAGARLFVAPSLVEGFGLTLLDAMRLGVPAIASATAAHIEVAAGATPTFDPGDADGLASLMEDALDDEALRAAICTRGLERAEDFSWERTAAATERAYARVME
ncbi:MAG TPA: glycosyltransferase family 1 protein [Gemmatimonadaceae bacterium]|nr:glycosyltransferase family 1 protein [Gemmatimonadaceae bacterium]